MNTLAKPRLDWVDILKGASIILVVLYHIGLTIDAYGFEADWLTNANRYLAPIRMPAFFMAAGFFARSSIMKPWTELATRRIAFYFYLFVLWSVVRFAFFAFAIDNPRIPQEGHSVRWLLRSLIAPETGTWFLWALAIFYLVTKLAEVVPHTVVIAIAAAASAIGFSNLFPLPFAVSNILQYFIFFYTACHYRELIGSLSSRPVALALASAPLFAVCTIVALRSGSWWVDGPTEFLAAFGGIGLMVAAATLIESSSVGNFLAYFGRHTLPIYVIHLMLVTLGAWWAVQINWNENEWGALGLTVALLALGVGGALIFERFSDRTRASNILFNLPKIRRSASANAAPKRGI